MTRTARALHVEALDVLLQGRVAQVVVARVWELLREVAALAESDAPLELAVTDPALFVSWRKAVTTFHLKGWSHMTPRRVDEVVERQRERLRDKEPLPAISDTSPRP